MAETLRRLGNLSMRTGSRRPLKGEVELRGEKIQVTVKWGQIILAVPSDGAGPMWKAS